MLYEVITFQFITPVEFVGKGQNKLGNDDAGQAGTDTDDNSGSGQILLETRNNFV